MTANVLNAAVVPLIETMSQLPVTADITNSSSNAGPLQEEAEEWTFKILGNSVDTLVKFPENSTDEHCPISTLPHLQKRFDFIPGEAAEAFGGGIGGAEWKWLNNASFQNHDDISWNFFNLDGSDVCVKMSASVRHHIGAGKVVFSFEKEDAARMCHGMKVDKRGGGDHGWMELKGCGLQKTGTGVMDVYDCLIDGNYVGIQFFKAKRGGGHTQVGAIRIPQDKVEGRHVTFYVQTDGNKYT